MCSFTGALGTASGRLVSASNVTFVVGTPGEFGRGHGENVVELGEDAVGDGAVSPRPVIIVPNRVVELERFTALTA